MSPKTNSFRVELRSYQNLERIVAPARALHASTDRWRCVEIHELPLCNLSGGMMARPREVQMGHELERVVKQRFSRGVEVRDCRLLMLIEFVAWML